MRMRRGLLLVFVVLLTFTLSSVPVEAKITWKFGHLANEQHI
ncbi:MAG: hypothetical protein PWQ16_758 [bacterium]|nr:hypothetical protein [bacterium]